MRTELITIGIPCYDSQNTIKRAIESALIQDWTNKEILVVNDGSTDDSAKIVTAMADKNPQIRLINHPQNRGVGAARATLIQEASGEFIAFFDDDDESHPGRIQTQHQRIMDYEKESGEIAIACYASGNRLYPNGYVLKHSAIGSLPLIPKGEAVADYLLFNAREAGIFYGAGTPACALMARKSTFELAGGFDSSFRRVEDSDWAVRLALKKGHFIGCQEELYTQYATTGSDKTPKANYEAETILIDKYKGYLEKKKRYDYTSRWFQIRFLHFSGKNWRAISALFICWLRHPFLTTQQFLRSAPRRLLHELRMGKKQKFL